MDENSSLNIFAFYIIFTFTWSTKWSHIPCTDFIYSLSFLDFLVLASPVNCRIQVTDTTIIIKTERIEKATLRPKEDHFGHGPAVRC